MSFEQNLRDSLSSDASSLPLPERSPERAAGRAAQRRRTRRATVAAVAGTAVLAGAVAVSPTVFGGDDDRDADLSIAAPGAAGLVPTGPLDVSWQSTDAGFVDGTTRFIDDDGTLFALSTSPGTRWEDFPDGDVPRTLYRLGDGGAWDELALDGDRPDAVTMSGADGLLYAVSTGPGTDGGVVARLSASSDGGDTWSTDDLPAVPSPGNPDLWASSRTMSVESIGERTVALVSTTWSPDWGTIFPELASQDPEWMYSVDTRDEGLVLTRSSLGEGGSPELTDAPATTVPPTTGTTTVDDPDATGDPATTLPPPTTTTVAPTDDRETRIAQAGGAGGPGWAGGAGEDPLVAAETVGGPPEDVRTVTWADLGVDGPEATEPHVQVFTRSGDAWDDVTDAAGGLAGRVGLTLDSAGDRFVATGMVASPPEAGPVTLPASTAFSSADGITWAPLPLPLEGTLTSVGSALVIVSFGGDAAQVSADGGVTWSDVDLAAAGVGGGEYVMGAGGGPLGLALTIGDIDDWEAHTLAVTGDLDDWTSTPIADVFGGDFPEGSGVSQPAVGEDTIALTRSVAGDPTAAIPVDSVTVVGTPTR